MAATVSTSEAGRISNASQVTDDITTPSQKWFSLQDNVLDGTYHPMDTSQQVGWWGSTLSDSTGALNPAPTLTITNTVTVAGIEVHGDSLLNEFPTDFTVDLYNNGTKVYTATVTGNNSVNYQQIFPTTYSVTSMVYTFTKVNKASRTIKILDVTLNATNIQNQDIVKPKLVEGTPTITVQAPATDSVKPKLTETMATQNSFATTDTVKPKITESSVITVEFTNTDTIKPKLVESSGSITADVPGSDALKPKVTEGASTVTNHTGTQADVINPKINDSSFFVQYQMLAIDVVKPKLIETSNITVRTSNVDTVKPKTAESAPVITNSFINTDVITPKTADSSFFTRYEIWPTTTIAPKLTEVPYILEVSETGNISVPVQLIDKVTSPSYKWFSLQNNLLDGSFHPMDPSYQVGWWSTTLSDSTGTLNPAPTITVVNTTSVGAIEIHGDIFLDDYPTDFTVDLYNGATKLYTLTVTGNTFINFQQTLPQSYNVTSVVYTFTKVSHPGRTLKILDIILGNTQKSATDILKPKLNDVGSLNNSLASSDAIKPRLDEAAPAITGSSRSLDTIAPKTVESANLTNRSFLSDVVKPKTSETMYTYVSLYASDTILVSSNLHESPNVNAKVYGSDVIKPKLIEQNIITNEAPTSDGIKVKATDIPFITKRFNQVDTLTPKVIEAISTTVHLYASDNALISQNMEHVVEKALTSNDTLQVKVGEVIDMTSIYTVMDQDVRQVYGKVVITYTDPYMDESITVTSNQVGHGTYTNQIADGVTTPAYKWFSLHENILDGSYHPIPDPNEYSVGLWGTVLSNPDGTLPTAMIIDMSFSARTLQSLKLVGDSLLGEYPVNFTFTAYDPNGVSLQTWTVTGNTLVDYELTLSPYVNNVAKVEINITKINKGGVVAKITEAYTAIVMTYEGDDIESIDLLEETGYVVGGLPIGNISSNEVDIAIMNLDRRFDINNVQSPLYGLVKRNRRVEVYLGAVVDPAIGIEWHIMGTFWTVAWDIPKNNIVTTFTARDRLELLRISQFTSSQVYQNNTLYQLFQTVFQDAGVLANQYTLDTGLQNITVPYAWFDRMSHRDAIQRLASCGIIQIFCTKDNVINVQLNFAHSATSQVTYDDNINIYDSKQPLAVNEQTNWVEVTAAKWVEAATASTVYDAADATSVPAGGTATNYYELNSIPAMNLTAPTITADTGVTVQSWTAYAWGMQIVFANSGAAAGVVHHVTISGQPLNQTSSLVTIAKDQNSINSDGIIKQTVQHDFIQDPAYAQSLANSILSSYSNARHDITIENRGNVALQLADQVTVNDTYGSENYMVTRQKIQWAGYLSATTEARKI